MDPRRSAMILAIFTLAATVLGIIEITCALRDQKEDRSTPVLFF